LLAGVTCSELATLRVLDGVRAFGERRADLRAAKLAMHVVACLRSSKSGVVHLEEFLLRSLDDPEPEERNFDTPERFDAQAGLV
jgi:hypothetical protein